jgi:hypothetical protein
MNKEHSNRGLDVMIIVLVIVAMVTIVFLFLMFNRDSIQNKSTPQYIPKTETDKSPIAPVENKNSPNLITNYDSEDRINNLGLESIDEAINGIEDIDLDYPEINQDTFD